MIPTTPDRTCIAPIPVEEEYTQSIGTAFDASVVPCPSIWVTEGEYSLRPISCDLRVVIKITAPQQFVVPRVVKVGEIRVPR